MQLSRHAAALQSEQLCVRCRNHAKRRTESRRSKEPRMIYLCDECFKSLPVYRLHDLFVKFSDKRKWIPIS
jgi:hypothetical protein